MKAEQIPGTLDDGLGTGGVEHSETVSALTCRVQVEWIHWSFLLNKKIV